MLKRTITGAILIAIVAIFIALRNVDYRIFNIMLLIVAEIGTYEIVHAFGDRVSLFHRVSAMAFPPVFFVVATFFPVNVLFLVMCTFCVADLSVFVLDVKNQSLESAGIAFFAMFYPSFLLLSLVGINAKCGLAEIILTFVVSPCADTFALLAGMIFGGKKLCPDISPKKTISGAIGGLIGGIAGGVLVYIIMHYTVGTVYFPYVWQDIILYAVAGFIGALLTEFGDLVESSIKRKLDIKDMGNILPGHGGMLDRVDGLIFAASAIYFCFAMILPIFIG